ncbi:unnamed protein product [Heterobilharzia americana]|nr:unnamed protein product [Heterobilharzia americana]
MSYCPVRVSSHAGSWYSSDDIQLSLQLENWLESCEVTVPDLCSIRALIVPHAGYRHSGLCAAHAYRQIRAEKVERIFIIGPSHHLDIGDTCALTCALEYETPFYNLKIDIDSDILNKKQDEAEHSVEMQLPYIAHIMKSRKDQYSIVPIVVGYFCHWGKRFRYQYYNKSDGEIWQSITKMDHFGLDAIQSLEPTKFVDYLKEYNNTICGRRGIGILLYMVAAIRQRKSPNMQLKILHYTQSNRCQSIEDSSVSYAACALIDKN